jgi:putative membrane protein
MTNYFLRLLRNSLVLGLVVDILPQFRVDNFVAVIVAAAVIDLFNIFIKPALVFITLPINILSLGVFTFVINGLILYLASRLVNGFYITTFWGAVLGAFIFSAINLFVGAFTSAKVMISGFKPPRQERKDKYNNVVDAEVVKKEDNKKPPQLQ